MKSGSAPLTEASEENLAALWRAIRRTPGFALYVIVAPDRARPVATARLEAQSGREGIPELYEALRIRREDELPVYERLGDRYALVRARAHVALICLRRARPEDRAEAAALLRLALQDAEAMHIPEAEQIRAIQRMHGLL